MKIKKSLGQNFFVNENLGNYIINILANSNRTSVVEIGPGLGFFTEKLIKKFGNVTVIEKDREIAQNLKFQFPKILVINNDFLDIDLNTIVDENTTFFGSLPFNVSKKIIKKIIESKYFTNPSFFIIQKEVAEKYLYKQPYSILSLTTAMYADCKKIFDISPDSFRPKPHVTSSFISFSPTSRKINSKEDIANLIKLSFRQPRKNILNNLKGTRFEKGTQEFKNLRPEQLSLDDFIKLYEYSS
jgi:16S rRNA (adenine1518-N6/adenine1519-N6)-dimethyltransferase